MHGEGRRLTTLSAIHQSTWVYSAISFICEHLMRTPFVPFRGDQPAESPELMKFISRPSSYSDQNTSEKFRYAYMFELLLHGAVMRLFGPMQGFRPESMSVRPRWHFRVRWVYDSMGRMVPTVWNLVRGGIGTLFEPNDTIYHDALYNPLHDFEGMAPLTAAMIGVSNDINIGEFANRFFENDASTGVIFTSKHPAFTNDRAREAAKRWKEEEGGKENAFRTRFVGYGLTPHNIGTIVDARMLQVLRTFTKEEIFTGIFKIPLDAISAKDGGGDLVIGGPGGGAQASAREAFLVNVVQPWAMRYDEDFNRDVTWRFDAAVQAKHDFTRNPILERRRLERATAAVQLIDRGVPLNEVIRWMQLGIVQQPHGDEWWIKRDHVPASVIQNLGQDAFELMWRKASDPIDPVENETADNRKKSQSAHVDAIMQLADSVRFRETVRDRYRGDPAAVLNGTGHN